MNETYNGITEGLDEEGLVFHRTCADDLKEQFDDKKITAAEHAIKLAKLYDILNEYKRSKG